jgi:hypothetical protein
MVLGLAVLLCAAVLRIGRPVLPAGVESTIAVLLVWVAAVVWTWRTAAELPATAASWWWWALAGGASAVGLAKRSQRLVYSGGVFLFFSACKFILPDCAVPWARGTLEAGFATGWNWQFIGAAVLAGTILAFGVMVKRMGCHALTPAAAGGRACDPDTCLSPQTRPVGAGKGMVPNFGEKEIRIAAVLLAAFIVLFAGSVEIGRHFSPPGWASRPEVGQYRQAAFSIWWSVYAAAILAAGFVWRFAPVRYMALAIFACVLLKVAFVDLAHIELAYRIVSLFAVGAVLLGASYLYQRYLRAALAGKGAEKGKVKGEGE